MSSFVCPFIQTPFGCLVLAGDPEKTSLVPAYENLINCPRNEQLPLDVTERDPSRVYLEDNVNVAQA